MQVSICLECNSSKLRGLKRKWIRCSAQATVLHLKKFIAKKLNLSSFNELDILCNEEILGKDHTLKFVVVTRWRFKTQDGPAVSTTETRHPGARGHAPGGARARRCCPGRRVDQASNREYLSLLYEREFTRDETLGTGLQT
ncbi:hypothetical protein K5549_018806 [Capra hircus]|nr:hypothetical protein K5549_018806 [Capra hircus]